MKKFFKKIVKNWVKIRRKKFKKFEKFSKYEKMLKNKWKLTGNVKKLYITSMKTGKKRRQLIKNHEEMLENRLEVYKKKIIENSIKIS